MESHNMNNFINMTINHIENDAKNLPLHFEILQLINVPLIISNKNIV